MINIKKTSKTNIILSITQENIYNVFTIYRNNKLFSMIKYKIRKIDFENQDGFSEGILKIGNGTISMLEKEIIFEYGKNSQALIKIGANTDYRAEMYDKLVQVFNKDIGFNSSISNNPFQKNKTNSAVDYINATANGLNALNSVLSTIKTPKVDKKIEVKHFQTNKKWNKKK